LRYRLGLLCTRHRRKIRWRLLRFAKPPLKAIEAYRNIKRAIKWAS
jgi:hypothetical protein